MERALLLFDSDFPCWDEETFALAGEEPEALPRLCESGCVFRAGRGYALTGAGMEKRKAVALDYYIEAKPILPFEPEAALLRNRLYLLMDRAFTGQFGVKEYSVNESLEVVPYLDGCDLWTKANGKIKYTWSGNALVRSLLAEFPNWGVGARGIAPPGRDGIKRWRAATGAKAGLLHCDLLLRSRYDFELYRHQPKEPSDIFHMKDADRLFFFYVTEDSTEEFFTKLGLLHLFLLGQRHVYIPGYADIDSQQQENWTMAVAVADDEKSLEIIASALSAQGRNLINLANPLFVIGTSLERLQMMNKPKDTVYDWFCEDTVHIARADE